MENCIFCAILQGKNSTKLEYIDSEIVAFKDISPKAKVHLLIIPKKHIPSVTDLEDRDNLLIGKMVMVAKKLAKDKGIADGGYRLVINVGHHGGQAVDHIHLHLLGGGPLGTMV